jgi:hypothetical protein
MHGNSRPLESDHRRRSLVCRDGTVRNDSDSEAEEARRQLRIDILEKLVHAAARAKEKYND